MTDGVRLKETMPSMWADMKAKLRQAQEALAAYDPKIQRLRQRQLEARLAAWKALRS